MRLYSADLKLDNDTLFKKYCLNLDQKINSVVNFIDNFNPNYLLVNTPNNYGQTFYSTENLYNLGILIQENNILYINPNKLKAHEVVSNTFQQDVFIYGTTIVVPQGSAVRCDGFNGDSAQYSIIPLASSGSYYVLKNIQISSYTSSTTICALSWVNTDNATDIYGLNYLFSLVVPGSRFYFHPIVHGPQTIDGMAIFNPDGQWLKYDNFIQTPAQVCIGTSENGIWNSNYLLSHEIYTQKKLDTNQYLYEEISGDEMVKVEETRLGESLQSSYIITTNLENIINSETVKIAVNLY